jgi:hypothetical protein
VFRGLFVALLLTMVLALSTHSPVRAADPSATPSVGPSPVLVDPLDPRAGEGASKVGAPFLALVVVVGLGLATIVGTYLIVRVTHRA